MGGLWQLQAHRTQARERFETALRCPSQISPLAGRTLVEILSFYRHIEVKLSI
jgi:hypothetical protein